MSNQESVILKLANSILEALQQDIVIDDEDYLYNDEFYITIVSNIVPENTCNIQVGETDEEKAESLTQLIQFLETIVEMNLNHINGRSIIFERDEGSVKDMLELILELIIILKQEQGDESLHRQVSGHTQPHSEENDSPHQESELIEEQQELQEEPREESSNYQYAEHKSCPEVEFDGGESSNSQIQYKENYSQNDLTRYEKVMAYLASNEEFMQQQENNQQEGENQHLYDMNFGDDSKPTVNISRISEVSRSKENSEPHSNQKYFKNNYTNNSKNIRNDSESVTIKHTNSNNKLQDSYNQYDTNEEGYNIGQNTESVQLDMNMDVGKRNYEEHEAHEEILTHSENEHKISAHEDESNYSNYADNIPVRKINEPNVNKNQNKSVKSVNTNKNKSDRDRSAKSQNSKNKSGSKYGNSNISNQNKSQSKQNESLKHIANQQGGIDRFESSNYENIENSDRILKKTKSQKQLIDQPGKRDKNNLNMNRSNNNKSEISVSSVNQSQSRSRRQDNDNDADISENLIEELPLNDENIKFEIMKEFRKLYGNKLDRVLLNNNLKNSSNSLEMILRNIKLARQKMVKLGVSQSDADDLVTKEFMIKYSKELEYIINYYQNEEKKRNFFKQRAVNTMSKNVKLIQKIQEIENKNIENEIERRRKSREVRNRHNQIKICNEIYSKALELEKQKYLEERAIQAELRRQENNEKRIIMTQIENYYKDKISILKEILRREKYEKELEHRAKIQFISKFEREKKQTFKKQIDEIFNRLDEEDRKQDFMNSNGDQLEKILTTYYKK